MAKYDPLMEYLQGQTGPTVTLSFEEISRMVDGLPNSAFVYDEWWANEPGHGRHVQARAWRLAGWRVESVDRSRRVVTFRKLV